MSKLIIVGYYSIFALDYPSLKTSIGMHASFWLQRPDYMIYILVSHIFILFCTTYFRYAEAIEKNPNDHDAYYNWALVLQVISTSPILFNNEWYFMRYSCQTCISFFFQFVPNVIFHTNRARIKCAYHNGSLAPTYTIFKVLGRLPSNFCYE